MSLAQSTDLNPLVPHPVELLILLMLLTLGLGSILLVIWVIRRRTGRSQRGRETGPMAVVRWAGLLVGVILADIALWEPGRLWPSPGLGVDAITAPIAFGLSVLIATIVGELIIRPRYDEGPRTADLRRRVPTDFLPPSLSRIVGATAGAGVLLCAFTWSTASTDDMGRAGRSLFAACSATVSSARGPYPGSFYVLPYAIGVTLALVIAVAAAWQVTRRTLSGTPAQADQHRRTSMKAIVGAFGVVVSAPLVGIAFFAGSALTQHACPQAGWVALGWLSFALVGLALFTLAYSLISLLAPSLMAPSAAAAPRRQESPRV